MACLSAMLVLLEHTRRRRKSCTRWKEALPVTQYSQSWPQRRLLVPRTSTNLQNAIRLQQMPWCCYKLGTMKRVTLRRNWTSRLRGCTRHTPPSHHQWILVAPTWGHSWSLCQLLRAHACSRANSRLRTVKGSNQGADTFLCRYQNCHSEHEVENVVGCLPSCRLTISPHTSDPNFL